VKQAYSSMKISLSICQLLEPGNMDRFILLGETLAGAWLIRMAAM